MADNDHSGSFVIGFLVGGIVGAAVGMLLAPKTGSDTRHQIFEQSEAWRLRQLSMRHTTMKKIPPLAGGSIA